MSFLSAKFYDSFMARSEEACLTSWRRELLEQLSGEVLEIGAGTGANLAFYTDRVSRLQLSEPDKHMRRQLQDKMRGIDLPNVSVTDGNAEHIEADDEAFDYVVTSLVCCSVTDLDRALHEITRVLKPGGGLVFLEHVAAAEGTSRRRWQNLVNPLWKLMMGNCHLNRETESAIIAAGLDIQQIQKESMRKALPIVRPTIRGIARKRAAVA